MIEGEIRGPAGGVWTQGASVRAVPVVDGVRLGYDPAREYDPARMTSSSGRTAASASSASRSIDTTSASKRRPRRLGSDLVAFAQLREVAAGMRDLVIDLRAGSAARGTTGG